MLSLNDMSEKMTCECCIGMIMIKLLYQDLSISLTFTGYKDVHWAVDAETLCLLKRNRWHCLKNGRREMNSEQTCTVLIYILTCNQYRACAVAGFIFLLAPPRLVAIHSTSIIQSYFPKPNQLERPLFASAVFFSTV